MIRPALESLAIHLFLIGIAVLIVTTHAVRPSANAGSIKIYLSHAAPYSSAPPPASSAPELPELIQEEAAPVKPAEPVIEQSKPVIEKPKPKPKAAEAEKVIKKPDEVEIPPVEKPAVPDNVLPVNDYAADTDEVNTFTNVMTDAYTGVAGGMGGDNYAYAPGGGIALPDAGAGAGFSDADYDKFISEFILLVQDKLYYPPNAKRGNIQGTVKVRVCFGPSGKMVSYELAKNDAHSMLNKAALTTLDQIYSLWEPPSQPGTEQSIVIPIIFEIK